ncbi:hypothetical protein [Streptomyces sp. NPDC057623]|uniref:hypothetical protein n=1 Tax=Streptomyces sp. NPDC057623 TaxID=3346187 RepID=UPI00369E501B
MVMTPGGDPLHYLHDFPASDVGTATSANNFFREIGATLGTAGVGAVFTHRLTDQLSDRLKGASAGVAGDTHSLTPDLVHSRPDKVQDAVILSYQHALTPVCSATWSPCSPSASSSPSSSRRRSSRTAPKATAPTRRPTSPRRR